MRTAVRMLLAGTTLLAGLLVAAPPSVAGFPGTNGKIAFTSDRDGATNTEIYAMNPDGSGQTNLTHNPAHDSEPAWSPDGSKIAFTSDRDAAGAWDVFVMNADGTGVVNLTHNPALDWTPSWSPTARRSCSPAIAPAAGRCSHESRRVRTSVQLTHNTFYDRHPKWSPDGTRIAFESYRDGNWEIVVMNADGTERDPAHEQQLGVRLRARLVAGFHQDHVAGRPVRRRWRRGSHERRRHRRGQPDAGPGVRPRAGVVAERCQDRVRQRADGRLRHPGDEHRRLRQGHRHHQPRERLRPELVSRSAAAGFTLTVAKQGAGSGSVRSSPAGIRCGADCSEAYPPGTLVRLGAFPRNGSTFTGWSGACSGTGVCSVTMNAAKAVTATFARS